MRVTSEMMVTGSLRRLQGRLERYERAQSALATGKWVVKPSDDPAQASRSLVLRAAMRSREQELRAATDARALLDRADGELQSAQNVLQRIRELTVRAANSVSAPEGGAIAEEIAQLQEQLVSIANARHAGRPLFAGFQDVDAVAPVAGVWTYKGDQGAVVRRVSDTDRVQVNVLAADVFGFAAGTDLFTALDDLQAAIQSGNGAGIAAGLDAVDAGMARVNEGLATIGAATNRVESARARVEDTQLALRRELAEVEDVDVAEAIMNLQVEEVAYQATLQALGRTLPDTLVAFLR
jgi:flagellar hook-associated protein 3 FlgL